MTLYGYQCRECGQDYTSFTRGNFLIDPETLLRMPCYKCEAPEVKRKYSLAVHRPMHEHMNRSTGTLISSDRQFRDELKRKSEEQFLRTGIPCQYEPIDHDEAKAAVIASGGVGLDSTNRVRVNEGKPPIKL